LQIVSRGDNALPEYSDAQEPIIGYDADLMRARATLSAEEEKKLLRRIDWHLLPLLSIMYMVKTIDAANVSNARIMDEGTSHNILTELHMTSNQYNFVTLAYYISWGVTLCCHAAVTNAGGLYTVRAFLGLFEAGLWPGMLLHLCYWYRPDEMAPRIVLVTILGNFSTARGLSGWKWMILTEGVFTIFLGISVYLFLPDFPSNVTWMSEKEKTFTEARLPMNAPRAAEKDFNLREFFATLKDKRLWLFLLCWAFFTVGTTGLTFYQPTVIANLGFTSIAQAQLLNIPPAVFACILTVIFGIFADTGRIPQPSIPLGFMIVIEACYVVLYIFPNSGGVYAATVIAGGFSTAWYTMMWPWRVQTTEGATGSAFAI
ncbi:MFS general substrate transporter, partial [Cryphonectria parasitica EP155]